MLLFSGTEVETCLDVVSLFYIIPIMVGTLFIFHSQNLHMHRCCNAEVTSIHLLMIEFYLALLNFFKKVHMFWPYYVMFI